MAAVGRQIAEQLTTVEAATALGWGTVPVFPALGDIPIDAGLLPVPQEFHVAGPEPGVAYYSVPPNTLWGVARKSGPSCGTYPSPYASSPGVARWGTYGYAGCFNPGPDGQGGQGGPPAQFEAAVLPSATPNAVPAAAAVEPTPTRRPAEPTRIPTAVPTPAGRPPLPDYAGADGNSCSWWPTGIVAPGPYNNVYSDLAREWRGPASNAQISALIDRGVAGIRGMRHGDNHGAVQNGQRCIDFLNNTVRPLLR